MKRIIREILITLFLLCSSPAMLAATELLLSESFNACELPGGGNLENLGGECEWKLFVEQEDQS